MTTKCPEMEDVEELGEAKADAVVETPWQIWGFEVLAHENARDNVRTGRNSARIA